MPAVRHVPPTLHCNHRPRGAQLAPTFGDRGYPVMGIVRHRLRSTQTPMTVVTERAPLAQIDPLTGFGTRSKLLADLNQALALREDQATLAIFNLGGFGTYVELYGRLEAETLLVRIAGRLSECLGQAATCYRPRYEEFATLLQTSPADAERLLDSAASTLNTRFEQFKLTLTYGSTVLHQEADEPISALALADTRLFLHVPDRRARERRNTPH